MKYKMIIFDADDTLFDFSKSEIHSFRKAMEECSLIYKEEYFITYKKINDEIWNEFEKGLITQKELKIDRFRRFLNEIKKDVDASIFSESFMNNLEHASFLFEDALELVEKISKTHRLIMVTNGLTRVQRTRIRKSVIAKYFETIIVSEDIGYAKPDPLIFEKGLLGISLPKKEEMMIVGDSLTSDIKGGINYGIDTVWYNPKGNINSSKVTPTYEIRKLSDIFKIA
jgi:putative hydrolase of the HAD superfamily